MSNRCPTCNDQVFVQLYRHKCQVTSHMSNDSGIVHRRTTIKTTAVPVRRYSYPLEFEEEPRRRRGCLASMSTTKPTKPSKESIVHLKSSSASGTSSGAPGTSSSAMQYKCAPVPARIKTFAGDEYYKYVSRQVPMNSKGRNHIALEEYKKWSLVALYNAMWDTLPGKRPLTIWKVLPTGSYYEKTKIKTANEFDIMLCTDHSNYRCYADFSNCPPLTCRIRCMYDLGPLAEAQLMCEHPRFSDCISPSKFKNWVGKTLQNCFQNDHKIDRLRDVKITLGSLSPGVAFNVKYNRRAGSSSEGFEADMVPAIHMPDWPANIVSNKRMNCLPCDAVKVRGNGYDIVPAIQNEDMSKMKHGHDTLWRLSFSRIEKQVFSHADERSSMKLHRKCTLRYLKYHVEEIKSELLDKNIYFTSIHLKHTLLHLFSEFPNDTSWVDGLACIVRALNKLIVFLKKQNLPHYFVPRKNLLEYRGKNITKHDASWLINELSEVKDRYVYG